MFNLVLQYSFFSTSVYDKKWFVLKGFVDKVIANAYTCADGKCLSLFCSAGGKFLLPSLVADVICTIAIMLSALSLTQYILCW